MIVLSKQEVRIMTWTKFSSTVVLKYMITYEANGPGH